MFQLLHHTVTAASCVRLQIMSCSPLSGCRRFDGEDPLEAFLEQVAKDLALQKEDLIVLPRLLVSMLVVELIICTLDPGLLVALSLWHMQRGQLCNVIIRVCVCAACAVTQVTTK
jgi:hypothetical protein